MKENQEKKTNEKKERKIQQSKEEDKMHVTVLPIGGGGHERTNERTNERAQGRKKARKKEGNNHSEETKTEQGQCKFNVANVNQTDTQTSDCQFDIFPANGVCSDLNHTAPPQQTTPECPWQ